MNYIHTRKDHHLFSSIIINAQQHPNKASFRHTKPLFLLRPTLFLSPFTLRSMPTNNKLDELPQRLPKMIVFDLDYTVWPTW